MPQQVIKVNFKDLAEASYLLDNTVGRLYNNKGGEIFNHYTANIASGEYSHAEGSETEARGVASHAEGILSTTIGDCSHAEGLSCTAQGDRSHAEGESTKALGLATHAEGESNTAEGDFSHAEGQNTNSVGTHSHSEGYSTQAQGPQSHAEGYSTKTKGSKSHAEGHNTSTMGEASHAEGYSSLSPTDLETYIEQQGEEELFTIWQELTNKFNLAFGDYSHTEGKDTFSQGKGAHAEGIITASIGDGAHSEGKNTQALGKASHAGGIGTIASGDAQTAIGKYNEQDNGALFIIGNGSENQRSNALKVTNDGTLHISNDIEVNGNKFIDIKHQVDIESEKIQAIEETLGIAQDGTFYMKNIIEQLDDTQRDVDMLLNTHYDSEPYVTLVKLPARYKYTISRDENGEIIREKAKEKTPKQFFIRCHNLNPEHNYKILLYTRQKNKGNGFKEWRHPKNTATGNEAFSTYTDENGQFAHKYKTGACTGYINLAERQQAVNNGSGTHILNYPSVPKFMLRNGVLQTEWDITTEMLNPNGQSPLHDYALGLNVTEWILDYLKPVFPTTGGVWRLDKKYKRIFKFCIKDMYNGKVYDCLNQLQLNNIEVQENNNTAKILQPPNIFII